MSYRYGAARQKSGISRRSLIVAGALAFVVAVAGLAVVLGVAEPAPLNHVVWIAEKTTRAPGGIPEAVRERVSQLSASGDGELVVYGVGERAGKVASMSLGVYRDGSPEQDSKLRERVIDTRLEKLTRELADAPVSPSGFSLYAALQVAADEAAGTRADRVEVWFSTTVFAGSVPPLKIRELTAGDPRPVAQDLLGRGLRGLDLSKVDLHPVTLDPTGPGQRPLSPADNEWRTGFLIELGGALGAQVTTPRHDSSQADPWTRASEVPPIEGIPPQPDPVPGRVDNVAFHADSADLVDERATEEQLKAVVAQSEGRSVLITGYCAAFGDPASARDLSKARADTIARLLAEAGVDRGHITTDGAGFDRRGDPRAGPRDAAQRVVVIELVPRR